MAGRVARRRGRVHDPRRERRVAREQRRREVAGAVRGAVHARAHDDDAALCRAGGADAAEEVGEARVHAHREQRVLLDAGGGLVAVARLRDARHTVAQQEVRADDLQHVGTEPRAQLGERAVGLRALPHVVDDEVRLEAGEPARTVPRDELRVDDGEPGRRRLVRREVLLRAVRRLGLVVRGRRRGRVAAAAAASGEQNEGGGQCGGAGEGPGAGGHVGGRSGAVAPGWSQDARPPASRRARARATPPTTQLRRSPPSRGSSAPTRARCCRPRPSARRRRCAPNPRRRSRR